MNTLYDNARYALLAAEMEWPTLNLTVTAWSGSPHFDATEMTIADIVARGYTARGSSLPDQRHDRAHQRHGADRQVLTPTVPDGPDNVVHNVEGHRAHHVHRDATGEPFRPTAWTSCCNRTGSRRGFRRDQHPSPAGYNADDNDAASRRVGRTVYLAVLFGNFIPLNVFILTPEMLAVFDGCPDYTVAWVDNSTMIPGEDSFIVPIDTWPDAVVEHANNVIMLPSESDVMEITDRWEDLVVPSLVRLGG